MTDNFDKSKNCVGEAGSDGLVHDPGRRYPFFTKDGYEQASYLSDKEKLLGIDLLAYNFWNMEGVEQPADHKAVQVRNPTMMLQSDPELFANAKKFWDILPRLVTGMGDRDMLAVTDVDGPKLDDPEIIRRFEMAMLIVLKVAHKYKVEWVMRLMVTGPSVTLLSKEQICLLDQPQSMVWNDEQSLMLEFSEAVMNYAVTNDLFARAEKCWGRKQTLRYAVWLVHYVGLEMLTHINVSDAERNGEVNL